MKKQANKLFSVLMSGIMLFGITACNMNNDDNPDNGKDKVGFEKTVVWTAPSTKKFLRDTNYSDYYNSQEIQISTFQNEYESAQIIISSSENSAYTITLSDLTRVGGSETIDTENISVFHEKYIEVKTIFDTQALTDIGWYPDALVPYENIVNCEENNVVDGQNQGIWITVHPEKDQVPGEYVGTATVKIGETSYSIPMSVSVMDYCLSDETHIVNMYGNSWQEVAYGELNSSVEIQEAYYEFFIDYRVSLDAFPGNEHSLYEAGATMEEFMGYVEKYAQDDRCSYYNIGHCYTNYVYHMPELDDYGQIVRDEFGDIVVETRGVTSTQMPLFKTYIEEMLSRSMEKELDLFKKAGHFSFYYDEYDLISDGDYRVNVNMMLMSRLFQQVAYNYAIEQAKENGVYNSLSDSDKEIVDELKLSFDKATYRLDGIDLSSNDPAMWELYDQRFGGTIQAIYDLFIARAEKDQEKMDALFDVLTEKQRLVMDQLISALSSHEQTVLDSLQKIKLNVTGPKMDKVAGQANFISLITDYSAESAREDMAEWIKKWYGEDAGMWAYICVNPKTPYPTYHLEDELLSSRLLSWMMYEYGIVGNLLWDATLYNVAGTETTVQDFYQNANRFPTSNGDGFMVYPGRQYGIEGPVGSIRLHSVRDGSEEYELFYALEEFYKTRAIEKGVTYDETTFNTLMSILTREMYNGVTCSYYDGYLDNFANGRALLNELLLMAANTNTVIDELTIENGKAKITVSTTEGNVLKIGEKTVQGFTENGITTYYTEIPFTADKNALTLDVSNSDGDNYHIDLVLSGKAVNYSLAGSNGKLEASDVKANGAVVTEDTQDDKAIWKVALEQREDTLNVDFNVSTLGINQQSTAITLDVYAEKAVVFELYVKVKNGAYAKVQEITLEEGWNSIVIDATQISSKDYWDLETVRFKIAAGESVYIGVSDVLVEEKAK